ncbi:hypothetical protein [Qipengyuania sp.]|uniref:hypothetical protein n=1 Tax=Qipengyuania sp. TaxID=2004515 RepID=UPI0035C85663
MIGQVLAASANSAGKYAAPGGILALLSQISIGGISLELVGAIVIGLIGGAVIRVSVLVQMEATRDRIQRDIRVSSLAALANFIIAGIMVAGGSLVVPGFPELAAAGIGLVVGFRGNDNLPDFARKWAKIDVGEIRKGLYRADPPPRDTPEELEQLARKLDDDHADR